MVKYTGDLSYPRKMDDMSELHHHQLLRPKEEQFPKIERNGYYLQYFKHLIVYCYSFQTQFIILITTISFIYNTIKQHKGSH
jgi:hypothetical protein